MLTLWLVLFWLRFSWRRNGKFFNIGKDPRVTMRKRSGTLEIGFRSGGRPEDYEGEYQCFATNDFGVALSNKILLRVSSKITPEQTHYDTNSKEICFNQNIVVSYIRMTHEVLMNAHCSLTVLALKYLLTITATSRNALQHREEQWQWDTLSEGQNFIIPAWPLFDWNSCHISFLTSLSLCLPSPFYFHPLSSSFRGSSVA